MYLPQQKKVFTICFLSEHHCYSFHFTMRTENNCVKNDTLPVSDTPAHTFYGRVSPQHRSTTPPGASRLRHSLSHQAPRWSFHCSTGHMETEAAQENPEGCPALMRGFLFPHSPRAQAVPEAAQLACTGSGPHPFSPSPKLPTRQTLKLMGKQVHQAFNNKVSFKPPLPAVSLYVSSCSPK